ncbi:MAG: ABC transporter ATP-binding protein [Pirellulales bacterium]
MDQEQTSAFGDGDEAQGASAAESSRLQLTALLGALCQAAGSATDRLAVARAVEESAAEDDRRSALLHAGIPAGEPAIAASGEATSADVDHSLEWLEDAAERLGLRLQLRRLPWTEAWRMVRRHRPSALVPCVRFGVAWAVCRDVSWRRLNCQLAGASPQWLTAGQLFRQLGLSARDEEVWVICPALSQPFRDDESPVGHEVAGAHGSSHGGHHPTPWRRLLAILQPEAGDIAVVAVFAAVVGLLTLASPIAVEALVNTVAFGRFLQPVVVLCLILLTFLAFAATLRILQAYVAEVIQRRIFVRVVSDLAYRLPRVRSSALDEQHGPELLNRFFDVMTVQKTSALLVLDGIAIVLQTVIGMLVLAFYHPYLLGFDVFLLGCLGVIVFLLGRGAVRTAIDESLAKYRVAAWLEELAGAPLTFKSPQGARLAWDIADRLTTDYVRARGRHFRVLLRQIVFAVGLQAVGSALLLGLGGWLVIQGQLSLGQLVAAELIVAVILGSFAKLGKQLESYYDLLAAVEKIGHLLDLPMERSTGASVPLASGPLGARLRRVDYEFSGGHGQWGGLSLEIPAGQFVALVGPPGSGKSLVLDLLYGLREPSAGRVELDGADLRTLQPAALRRQLWLVRDGAVLTGTVAENVHLDRAGVGLPEMREALETVGLWEELLDLPRGLETLLSPAGRPLSESQKRRLLLARALAGRPRMLLIDSLLDSLPAEVMPRIMETLRNRSRECTVVLVTGREDLAQQAARVLSMPPRTSEPSVPQLVGVH